jgi:hypothetical protein
MLDNGKSGKGVYLRLALPVGRSLRSVVVVRLHIDDQFLTHMLAAMPGDADEGRKHQHSHTRRGRVYGKEQKPIDDCLEPSRPDSCFVLPPTPARQPQNNSEVECRDAAHPDWERDNIIDDSRCALNAAITR